ncbi:MAG: hypothetical protein QOF43_1146 [Gaiellaceae bacterium]|nr:hypothetical protein [Gaiellaceae bacterium]
MKRLREEHGYSLVELVAVCALLGVVMAGVTAVMVGGSRAELQLNRRFQAQVSARTALSVFRNDAHIACSVVVNTGKTQATLSIPIVDRTTNPVTPPSPTSQCGTTTSPKNVSKVIWCVLTSPSNSTRYAMYRSTTSTCTSTSKILADNLVNTLAGFNGFFLTGASIPNGQLQTVTIDIPVNLKVGTSGAGAPYDLSQAVTLRNGVWAAAASTSCSAAAPCTAGLCTLAGVCYPPVIS